MSKTLKIATRESALALWQAEYVKAQLEKHHPELVVELVKMTSKGDQLLDSPLSKIGGKGLFVKELEQALLDGRADIAVHSMKDVPMHFPEGLALGIICPREQPFDAFVSNHYASLDDLPQGATVGTSSLRRQSQIKAYRPDLVVDWLRGNVNSRLAKLDKGMFDAIILAEAGLIRLGMAERVTARISDELCLPACGQGAVGIEIRSDDEQMLQYLAPLADASTTLTVTAERAMNTALNGGCQVPIAGFATLNEQGLYLRGLVASEDGSHILRAEASATADIEQAQQLGVQVAEDLLAQGADKLLAAINA